MFAALAAPTLVPGVNKLAMDPNILTSKIGHGALSNMLAP